MILVDTGPLVALFDPADSWHQRCVKRLTSINEPIVTTIPVLTEALHILTPASIGAQRLMEFIAEGGLNVWFMDDEALGRAFELLVTYANVPMDLADASLVVAAESMALKKVFSIDRRDFAIYRIARGRRLVAFEVIN